MITLPLQAAKEKKAKNHKRTDSTLQKIMSQQAAAKEEKAKNQKQRMGVSTLQKIMFLSSVTLKFFDIHSRLNSISLRFKSLFVKHNFIGKTSFIVGGHNSFKWEIFKHQNLSSCDTTWWERTLTCTIYMTS